MRAYDKNGQLPLHKEKNSADRCKNIKSSDFFQVRKRMSKSPVALI